MPRGRARRPTDRQRGAAASRPPRAARPRARGAARRLPDRVWRHRARRRRASAVRSADANHVSSRALIADRRGASITSSARSSAIAGSGEVGAGAQATRPECRAMRSHRPSSGKLRHPPPPRAQPPRRRSSPASRFSAAASSSLLVARPRVGIDREAEAVEPRRANVPRRSLRRPARSPPAGSPHPHRSGAAAPSCACRRSAGSGWRGARRTAAPRSRGVRSAQCAGSASQSARWAI